MRIQKINSMQGKKKNILATMEYSSSQHHLIRSKIRQRKKIILSQIFLSNVKLIIVWIDIYYLTMKERYRLAELNSQHHEHQWIHEHQWKNYLKCAHINSRRGSFETP